jgi:uncharacterized protein
MTARRPGPDVVRSIALLGVIVMNYHGYMILRGAPRGDGWASDLFDPWTGPLSTRFAATFVLVAGVGVTLMTASSVGDPERVRAMRWRLASRGMALYAFGLAFDFIWAGTILPFYGAMFACAALMFTLRSRWIVTLGVVSALAAWALRWWRLDQASDGFDTAWLTDPGPRSVRGLLFDVSVNGTHPLLPWLAFFCAGIVVGRLLATSWWRTATIGFGLVLLSVTLLAREVLLGDSPSATTVVLLSTDPFERGGFYVASALSTALIAFGLIASVAERWPATWPVEMLRRAGQLSLTVYVFHALAFNLVVDRLGWIEPRGLSTALVFAVAVWFAGTTGAVAWQTRYGRGPLEHVYRSITA